MNSFFYFLSLLQKKLNYFIKFEKVEKFEKILALDCAYKKDLAICAAVYYDLKKDEIIKTKIEKEEVKIPYVPTFLFIREAPIMIKNYENFKNEEIDLILVDGHGLAHPRRAGLASIMGILTDTPSIGIAKRLLVGEIKWEDNMVGRLEVAGECVGIAYKNKRGKVFYASIGHMVDLQTIYEVASLFNYDEPLPILLAHRASRRKIKEL